MHSSAIINKAGPPHPTPTFFTIQSSFFFFSVFHVHFNVDLCPQRLCKLFGTRSPGRPPLLSRSSWAVWFTLKHCIPLAHGYVKPYLARHLFTLHLFNHYPWASSPTTSISLPHRTTPFLHQNLLKLGSTHASRIMKKSSPGSPCFTISSPSSNCTGSKASATVSRSHLSRFSADTAKRDSMVSLPPNTFSLVCCCCCLFLFFASDCDYKSCFQTFEWKLLVLHKQTNKQKHECFHST